MIRQHGKRSEQLPKLLYTSPFKSTEYRNPVCVTSRDWQRMKFMLHKNEIITDAQNTFRAKRLALHEKSQEMIKKWHDGPENLHLRKQKALQRKEESEEELKKQLSNEITKYREKITRETLAHHRLQLMCRSHKGRLLTKGILSDAAARERQLQLESQHKKKEYDKMVQKSFGRAVLEDQESYRKKMKEKEEAKIKKDAEYYKDLDKQVAFQKDLRAREDEVERLDCEQLMTLNDEYKRIDIQSKIDKKKKQSEMAAVYDKQCEEKRLIQKFEREMDRYDDEVVHAYIMNKRAIKQSHVDFLEQQKRLRQQKEDVVFDYIVKANQKKIDQDVSETNRIKNVKIMNDLALKKEREEKEKFEAHLKEFNKQKDTQKKIWEKIKEQQIVEQSEEHKRLVEDDVQDKDRERQIQAVRHQFNVDVKECQYQQIMDNAKRRENARLCEKLQSKHVCDAYNKYDKDVDSFAQDLIDYAKEQGWPTDHLDRERFVAKWCDHDHMFLGLHRRLPKVSKEIRQAQYKQDVKM
uniref:Trichohyalin-plectin-homology domain-containing protein n=1 Tax=Strigamia maritima TaxID=126957 RepID=T1JJV3_STRMM